MKRLFIHLKLWYQNRKFKQFVDMTRERQERIYQVNRSLELINKTLRQLEQPIHSIHIEHTPYRSDGVIKIDFYNNDKEFEMDIRQALYKIMFERKWKRMKEIDVLMGKK